MFEVKSVASFDIITWKKGNGKKEFAAKLKIIFTLRY
jgi:hypothetical protein